eukprot:1657671-Amphidinium_carterae.1
MEIFGGVAGVSKLALHRHMHVGPNLDLVCGVDLTLPRMRHEALQYVKVHRPIVVILAPPCPAFGSWSRLNAVVHEREWRNSERIGIMLSRFAASVAREQVDNG